MALPTIRYSNQRPLPDYRINEEVLNFESKIRGLFITEDQRKVCILSYRRMIKRLPESTSRQILSERALDAVFINVEDLDKNNKKFLVETLGLEWDEYKEFI